MTYVDFHTHTQDPNLYRRLKVFGLVNCMTVDEVMKWLPISRRCPYIKLSIGCHPNHPEILDQLLPYYHHGQVIGEIGLDNCWSKAPLEAQRHAFIKSLDLAQTLNKPVILHTKGMEAEVFDALRNYRLQKIIHWYSGPLDLLKTQNLDQTYFTIGPDLSISKEAQALVKWLPTDKILVETDGLEAIRWAGQAVVDESSILKTLTKNIEVISYIKQVDVKVLKKQMLDLFHAL